MQASQISHCGSKLYYDNYFQCEFYNIWAKRDYILASFYPNRDISVYKTLSFQCKLPKFCTGVQNDYNYCQRKCYNIILARVTKILALLQSKIDILLIETLRFHSRVPKVCTVIPNNDIYCQCEFHVLPYHVCVRSHTSLRGEPTVFDTHYV